MNLFKLIFVLSLVFLFSCNSGLDEERTETLQEDTQNPDTNNPAETLQEDDQNPDTTEAVEIISKSVCDKTNYLDYVSNEAPANSMQLLYELTGKTCQLQGVNFSDQDLSGYNFSYSNLGNANFARANLTTANFEGANLYSANFYKANLTAANLQNAKSLFHAYFVLAVLNQATYTKGAKLNHWTRRVFTKNGITKVQERTMIAVEPINPEK